MISSSTATTWRWSWTSYGAPICARVWSANAGFAPEAAVAIAADVADGLAAAHAARIVHRDVKPENVLLDMQGPLGPGGAHPALLTDFGIARLVDSPRRTRATKVIGTPDYLAPEIIEGLPPRASVDVYALATVLYELLAGFTPFGGGHPGAVLRRHVTESVAPLPGIPDELWQLLLQCLAKAPAVPAARPGARRPAARAAARPGRYAAAGHRRARQRAAGGRAGSRRRFPRGAVLPVGAPGEATPPRGAVPLVQGAVPDSNRETHTSMRVPGPDELAGGAHGTARAPRAAGERRAGSARHRSSPDAVRRRRIKLGAAAAAVALAAYLGGWLASGDDPAGDATPGVHQPEPGTP